VSSTDPYRQAVAYPLSRDILVVSGADATTYLQGQLSQDLAPMVAGDSRWTFALAPTGRVDAWFRVSRRSDDWILDVDAGFGPGLAERLRRFLLRTDATVASAEWAGVAVRGPGATGVRAGGTEVAADAGWPGLEGLDLLGPEVSTPPDLPTGPASDLEALRIEAGVPAMGREFDGGTIPAATGVVDRSVSFTKGCFTGQELVARIDSRDAGPPSRLCGLSGPAEGSLEPGSVITVDGAEVGTVTSVARPPWRDEVVGLIDVRRAVQVPVEVDAGAGGVVAIDPLPRG
jgi:folate-binding protein YgfZ